MHFFHFYSCSSNLFCWYLFFGAFFYNFFNGFEISVKFWFFFTPFLIFCKKKIFCVIFVLFSNFEAKRAKNGSKNQKSLFGKCVLDFNFAPIKGSVFFISKKSQIRCTLMCTPYNPWRQCLAKRLPMKLRKKFYP